MVLQAILQHLVFERILLFSSPGNLGFRAIFLIRTHSGYDLGDD